MTDPTSSDHSSDAAADEATARSDAKSDPGAAPGDGDGHASAGAGVGGTATAILESIRVAVDDLAERASPAVREFSARAAELTAVAADRAAPLVRRAGDVTSDASGKLAERSRTWAAEVRRTLPGDESPSTSEKASETAAPNDDDAETKQAEDPTAS
jgi:hypothetical protein